MANRPTLSDPQLKHPRYWLTWLLLGLAWLTTQLPQRGRLSAGTLVGIIGYRVAKRRRNITRINLQLCFPELNEAELKQRVKQVFRSTGIGLIETATVWLTNPNRYRHQVKIHGLEHLQTSKNHQQGILLVGMHQATLDFAGAVVATYKPFDVMYKANKNTLIETVMTRGRSRNFPQAIEHRNIRKVIKNLRNGHIVWYAPDQDYGLKHSVFAPFFGLQTASISVTSRIAELTDAKIVFMSQFRVDNDLSYEVFLTPGPKDYPNGDSQVDAAALNLLIESAVRKAPEQYLWLHRRFKTRPAGEASPYSNI
ncbi:MAG: LpxL/LpxP family Kdo(2)-lipid IV(A) lauroyl/palmitoleoyl acyltransferase [Gammaproteobacteria bacterium]|nr:LpxL/LpxP family Kdo(2)-lipid IV(A) lauroyl/palmitoleoyl acyltransferase [Gammaproteobacteria bacterium]